jgi:hypothetical protein
LIDQEQRADWEVKSYQVGEGSIVLYWGTPEYGDRPRDIRTRPFTPYFRESLHPDIERRLVEEDAVVLRYRYYCLGSCCRDLETENALKEEGLSLQKGVYCIYTSRFDIWL